MGMAFARDEVHWLVRHQDSLATLKDKRPKPDLEDRLLPELLFHVEELRALVRIEFKKDILLAFDLFIMKNVRM